MDNLAYSPRRPSYWIVLGQGLGLATCGFSSKLRRWEREDLILVFWGVRNTLQDSWQNLFTGSVAFLYAESF